MGRNVSRVSNQHRAASLNVTYRVGWLPWAASLHF
nr:MAG TPA: hypothetical protein [Caudoviricetes sp.]